jgi:hypothetical protein
MAVRNANTQIELTTVLLQGETWDGIDASTLPWLFRGLRYAWSFKVNNKQVLKSYDVDLFSRMYPSRFEIELDVALDNLVFGGTDANASALYSAFLLTQM